MLDEMHSPGVAERLRVRGYDAIAVKERPDLVGLPDPELLAVAATERRVLVTENIKDVAALHQRSIAIGDRHGGLVFTHPRRFPREARNHVSRLADALARLIDNHVDTLRRVESFVWWLEAPER